MRVVTKARSLFILLILGLFFGVPAYAAPNCCTAQSNDPGTGKPLFKVEIGSGTCPAELLTVNDVAICEDASIKTYTPAEYKSFSEGIQKSIDTIIDGGAGVADGVISGGKKLEEASSLLNHGGSQMPWSAQTLNPLGMSTSIETLIGKIIKSILGIVGTIAFAMFIYSGFLWMVSAGNSDNIQKAQHILVWSTLGIAVIFSSYAIVSFVFDAFSDVTPSTTQK